MIRAGCDLSRLDMTRPVGAAVYAAGVLEALRAAGVEVSAGAAVGAMDGRGAPRQWAQGAGRVDVTLCLDGRFRAARGTRTVTAVLDLGHLFERRAYGPAEWLAQNWRVASATRRSDHLLAPSPAVADALVRYLRVPPERVTVFEVVPGPAFRRCGRAQVEEVRRRFGLPERYFLFVGRRSRRKHLGLLARAWADAAPHLGPDVGLVLAGPGTGGVPGALDLGYVDREALPPLLTGAIAWLNPSLYEGSALGAREAMACGAPPVVAATGATPRAVDRAGVVLEPRRVSDWAAAMVGLARRPETRASLGAAGLKAIAELRARRDRSEPLLRALAGPDRPRTARAG
jgi:glycosyltransferase involved in cell wall biosynthesis